MNIEAKLRPCKIFRNREEKVGLFHRWGTTSMMNNLNGDLSTVTIAIVEVENGKVITISPDQLKFTDDKFKDFCFK